MINKFLKLFFVCSALITLSGCLKVKQTLTLNKNGSGIIAVKYSISERAVNQLNSMRKLQEQMQQLTGNKNNSEESRYVYMFLNPNEKEIRKELESYAEYGVKIKKLQVNTRNAWRHVDLKVTFDDLKKLSQIPAFGYMGFSLVKNKNGNYVFYRANTPDKNIKQPDLTNDTILRQLSPILSGFNFTFILRTPGTVLRTNADRKSTFASMWSFDFDKDPQSIAKLQRNKFITIFSSSGIDIPEIRVNNNSQQK